MRRFAITDIHGCRRTFEALLNKIILTPDDELYLLGDYIDRGPDSKGVLDLIIGMQQVGFSIFCLRGNHEQMFLDLANTPPDRPFSIYQGLVETLNSYGCRHPAEITQDHLAFLDSLPHYFEVEDYILVHGGLNFNAPDPLSDQQAMLWERNWHAKINKAWLKNRIILHGHTPTPAHEIEAMFEQLEQTAALNLDSGCVFNVRGLGRMTAFDMTNRQLIFQKNVEN